MRKRMPPKSQRVISGPACGEWTKPRASAVLPFFHAKPLNQYRRAKGLAIGSRWCLMLAACGLVRGFAGTLLLMTKMQTDQRCLDSDTPAWAPVPSTPFFPHRGYFGLYCAVSERGRA